MIPKSFIQESDTQRAEEVAELKVRVAECVAGCAADWPILFRAESYENPEPPRPEMFVRAARTVVALDDEHLCTTSNLSRITFRPYPSKYEGAWRIEVSFKRNGPCAGSEWYEPAEKLWEAWEKAVACGRCGKARTWHLGLGGIGTCVPFVEDGVVEGTGGFIEP